MTARPSPSPRLGLIVNPLAGLGGRVGLKGTDGAEIVRRALELGAEPAAPGRAERALTRLDRCGDRLSIVAGARAMGGDLVQRHPFRTEILAAGDRAETTANDTRAAAAEMERRDVELILFAGGDGTGRDIVETVGTRVAILGIPTGVKMQSGVFATSPEAAGDVAAAHLCGAGPRELRDAEVLDVDEEALRAGRVSAQLYAVARVPFDRARVQHPKAASRSADADLDALCRQLASETDGLTLYGPGTTTQRVLRHLGVEGTLLGVDAVEGGALVGRDLNEHELLRLLDGRAARLVVGVVGGQGYVFGRGNQQLSPQVIRRVGLDRIELVAALDKLVALDPPTLRVDTGDAGLDRELSGFRRVRVAPGRTLVLAVST
jgi:predicted polyphosphate/ATP-dependent NAD kinase